MGKASRRKDDRRASAAQRPWALLAAQADRALDEVISAVEDNLALLCAGRHRPKLDKTVWPLVRQDALQAGVSWPTWCWLPYSLIASAAYRDMAALFAPGVAMGDFEVAMLPLVTAVNWLPGRTAVRYDPELLDSFEATPIDERIPVQALYRLPAWGLYLDCPFIADGAGVLTCLDPGEISGTDSPIASVDELVLSFVVPGAERTVTQAAVRLSEPSVAASLAAQERDRQASAPSPLQALSYSEEGPLTTLLGRPLAQVLTIVTSILLYLCTDAPDVRRHQIGTGDARSPRRAGQPAVLEVGWRLGAALRSARQQHGSTGAGDSERRVTPHLRRAHWHSYWTGPRSDPEARELQLRYVAPVQVGRELPTATVARPASSSA